MIHKSCILFFFAFLLCVTGCAQGRQQDEPRYTSEQQQLREDIGEMLLVGFRGTALIPQNHILRDIKEYHVGGVILFEYDAPSGRRPRNVTSPEQLKTLCSQLQDAGDGKLLIGIDQEGGKVNRLKERYGFPSFYSAQHTAQVGDDSVRDNARRTATVLHDLGINLNFAPCVDVNINPDCPVIGKLERSFSANPKRVTACARIWIEEQRAAGVVSCLKHFPGHGSSSKDTHDGLVDVSHSWQRSELVPYATLIEEGQVEMVMTTHVFNGHLDSVWPATLSQPTLTVLLRDSLQYQGVIVTDDLAMGAMVDEYSYEEIVQRSILAGADLLCLSNNGKQYDTDLVPNTVELIYGLVQHGKIPAERIHASAHRIRALKKAMLKK